MVEHRTLDPDDLDRPEWNSLLNNYSKHDIGEAYFQGRVEQIGLQVEHWGIDRRHQDDHLIFDNKMDLRLWEPQDEQERTPDWPDPGDTPTTLTEEFDLGFDSVERTWELRGVADVKTKANPDWLGVFNLRHLAHYSEWADHYEVPTFVYMTMVDAEAEQVGTEDFLTPITTDWEWGALVDHYDTDSSVDYSYGELKDIARGCDIVERTFRAPDGNLVIEVDDEQQYNWDWFTREVLAK